MKDAIILSVGGSPEPIIKSIQALQPDFICFLASQESVDRVSEIKNQSHFKGKDVKVIVDDPQDLVSCYNKAMECVRIAQNAGHTAQQITIDFTGGTKVMTAALSLAALTQGCQVCYIGGTERDKGGLGVVISGYEEIKQSINPWTLFAVEEKKKVQDAFNSNRFYAVKNIVSQLPEHVASEEDTFLLKRLAEIADGYDNWDKFNHREAIQIIKPALEKKLIPFSKGKKMPGLSDFLSDIETNMTFLEKLQKTREDSPERMELLILDLLANAERRARDEKYDDAVIRCYRALEMIGQKNFIHEFKCKNDNVSPHVLPDSLKEDYLKKYSKKDGNLELPLFPTFLALAEKGNPAGLVFRENLKMFSDATHSRNHSILAHGTQSVGESGFTRLFDLVLEKFGIKVEDCPRFPQLCLF